MRTILGQQRHNSVVVARASELVRTGERVWADVDGYPQPQLISGYRPDIMANGMQNLISEVETSDTHSSTHTKYQLAAFASVPNYQLEVVVPESVYLDAQRLYSLIWGITVNCWRTFRG